MTLLPNKNKLLITFTTVLITTTLLMIVNRNNNYYESSYENQRLLILDSNQLSGNDIQPTINWRGLSQDQINNLTELGRILYLQDKPPTDNINGTKTYTILIWKYGKTIESRHMKHFSGQNVDPFEHCSVKNCRITYTSSDITTADIVIFHLHRMKGLQDLPPQNVRNPKQIWTFLTDESPYNTFLFKKNQKLPDYNGIFNWSMTYRMNSDIPVPYGRTILRKSSPSNDITIRKRRDVLVAVMGSNCGGHNHRWKYIDELKKYVQVDVYGGCGNIRTCPGHFKSDCPHIGNYLFYLAFENSNCDEYITEKLWWNAYKKDSIPIVMGASRHSYGQLLPPQSYLNVEDYATAKDLAMYILYLNQTDEYRRYYYWKRNFEVVNEHGYFQSESFHYCRICEAMNYNRKEEKIYRNLGDYWNVSKACHPAWDQQM